MSVTRILSIHCDGCGDWRYANNDGETAAEVRRDLRRFGWLVAQRGLDFCKKCKSAREEAAP